MRRRIDCNVRIRAERRNHRYFFLICRSDAGQGAARCVRADDEIDLVVQQLLHGVGRFRRFAAVVGVADFNFLSQQAAGVVDFLDGHFDAVFSRRAVRRAVARQFQIRADLNRIARFSRTAAAARQHDGHRRNGHGSQHASLQCTHSHKVSLLNCIYNIPVMVYPP